MILKKVIINENEVFEPISFEDALVYDDKDNLVFTDEDEKEKFEDRLEDPEDDDEDDEEEEDNEEEDDDEYDEDELFLGGLLNHIYPYKKKSKTSRIVSSLPFLDKEDLHEIVGKILNGDEDYKDISPTVLFPFLSKDDCDELFLNVINNGEYKKKFSISTLVPFVSKEALSKFVDKYIGGEYQNVKVDYLFPFMSKADVKRIFNYFILKESK